MRAQVGDHIVLTGDRIVRDGEVIEVRGEDGQPPYLVRWASGQDDGQEALVFPGSGAALRVAHSREEAEAATAGLLTAPSPLREWQIRISLFESGDDTTARLALVADALGELNTHGQAHRGQDDPDVPRIGDEVALARALRRLSDQLLDRATHDVSTVTGEDDVVIRPS